MKPLLQLHGVSTHFHPFHVAEAWARGFSACFHAGLCRCFTLTDVTKTQVLTTCCVPRAHARSKTLKLTLTEFRVASFHFPSLYLLNVLFVLQTCSPSLAITVHINPCTSKLQGPYLYFAFTISHINSSSHFLIVWLGFWYILPAWF